MIRTVLLAVGCSLLASAGAFAPPAAPLRAAGARQGLAPSSCAGRESRLAGPLALRASVEDLLSPFGEGGKKVGKAIDWFFDTSEVAGAKAWRLQQIPGEADAAKWRTSGDELEELMQDQINAKRQKAGAARGDRSKELGLDGLDDGSFTDGQEYSMTDEDLEDALSKRLAEISSGKIDPTIGAVDEGLTGMELAELCVKKYGVAFDMSIKCDKFELVSDKKLVSLNLYYAFYGQLNPPFPYSQEQYIGRLSYMASMINQWGQAQYVRDFFKEAPTAKRGLPSRPRWDTAVSIRLSSSPTWNPELVEDFFMQ